MALGQQKSFVACPIVRDTKTVPCFLAEYDGETYFLGIQQDVTSEFHPPQLKKHQVLVEGRIAEGVRESAAAFPLSRFPISVLKEISLSCNTLASAGARNGRLHPRWPRRCGNGAAAPGREGLTGRQEFTVMLYAFDDDYVDYAASQAVTGAAAYAKRIGAEEREGIGVPARPRCYRAENGWGGNTRNRREARARRRHTPARTGRFGRKHRLDQRRKPNQAMEKPTRPGAE